MATRARFEALAWFHDHDLRGPDGVLGRKLPSTKMRRLMAREGQVIRLPIGQFEYHKWLLTPQGREALQAKPPKKRRKADADERNPKPVGE